MNHESVARSAPPKSSSDRTFGFVFFAFFLLVAFLPLLRGGAMRTWSVGVSVVVLVVALVMPVLLSPFNKAWMLLGKLLHRITSPIVLGLMFYLVIAPAGLIMRAMGKDPLRLRSERTLKSYWILRDPPGPAPESLNRQF